MEGPLTPYVPRLAAEWPADLRHAGRWQTVEGTLTSVDLSGFTRLSERLARQGRAGSEEVTVVVSGIFTRLIDLAFAAGGDVLKFGGDAILVLFTGPDHERRAVTAVTGMQRLIRHEGRVDAGGRTVRLRMSVGAHSGSFWFFLVGSTHLEVVVAGPDATTTVALESAAQPGQVLVSPATARALPTSWLADGDASAHPIRLGRVPAGDASPAAPVGADGPRTPVDDLIPLGLRPALLAGTTTGEHRPASIAFVELPGLDAIAASEGANGVVERLDAVAKAIDAAVDEHGISWLASDVVADGAKFILAAGAPTSAENDEERILRAARAISDAAPSPGLQIGVNRGPIFMGDVGHPDRRSYTVMGDAVNLAARLMAKARPGEVIVSDAVIERSAARFEMTALEPFLVKGKTTPIHAVALGPLAGWARSAGSDRRLPLLGREPEIEGLRGHVASTVGGRGAVVEIVAEAGMGKSRLLEELEETAGAVAWLSSHAEPYEQVTPYFPLRRLLRPLAGIVLDAEAPEASSVLTRWVGAVAPDLVQWLPLVAACFGTTAPSTAAVDRLDPSLVQTQLGEVMAQLLGRVLTEPTVLAVEDLHWADHATVELLRRLAAEAGERPWLLLVTRRPDGPVLGPGVATYELSALGPAAASRLAVAAAGDVALADDELDRITRAGGGHPLFVRELAAAADDLHASGPVPESVDRLIGSRIDTLHPSDRALLRDASVLGGTIDLTVLADVLDDPSVDDPGRWVSLDGFVDRSGPLELRFRHDLVRARAYEALPYRRRRLLHGRAGDAILERTADPDTVAPVLSLHFAEGMRHGDAWTWSTRAADGAQASAAMAEVVELLQRALTAARSLPALPAGEVARVAELLGDAADRAGRFALAADSYREARRLRDGDRLATVRLLRKQGAIADHQGAYVASLRWYGRGLNLLESDPSDEASRVRADLQLAYGVTRYYQGRFADAVAWAERANEIGRRVGDDAIQAQAELQLEMACSDLRRSDRAEHGERALTLFEGLGDDLRLGHLLLNLGVSEYNEGRWDEARSFYARSATAYRRAGDVVGAASTLNNEAEILTDQGRLDDADRRLDDARRIYRSAGYQWGVALTTSGLSRLALRRGDADEAHRLLDQAEDEFRALESAALVIDTRVRQVECLVYEGRPSDVLALADVVDAEMEAFGSIVLLPAVMTRLRATAQLQLGDVEGAVEGFERGLAVARAEGAAYEVAMCLTGLDAADRAAGREPPTARRDECRSICGRLGVLALPEPPTSTASMP